MQNVQYSLVAFHSYLPFVDMSMAHVELNRMNALKHSVHCMYSYVNTGHRQKRGEQKMNKKTNRKANLIKNIYVDSLGIQPSPLLFAP